MTAALNRSGRVGIPRLHQLFLPALVLAFGVVGWSHLYHAAVLGYADTPVGHTAHVLRDGLLAVPVALVALAGAGADQGAARRSPRLRLSRACWGCCWSRRPACTTRSTLAWLPPASTTIDAALAPADLYHQAGLVSLLEHGGRYALLAQVVALPPAPLVLGRWGRRRPARVRGSAGGHGGRACLGEPARAHRCRLDRQHGRDSLRHDTPSSVRPDRQPRQLVRHGADHRGHAVAGGRPLRAPPCGSTSPSRTR